MDSKDPAVNNHIDHEIGSLRGSGLRKDEEEAAKFHLFRGWFDSSKGWNDPRRKNSRRQYESGKAAVTGGQGDFDWDAWRRANGKASPTPGGGGGDSGGDTMGPGAQGEGGGDD